MSIDMLFEISELKLVFNFIHNGGNELSDKYFRLFCAISLPCPSHRFRFEGTDDILIARGYRITEICTVMYSLVSNSFNGVDYVFSRYRRHTTRPMGMKDICEWFFRTPGLTTLHDTMLHMLHIQIVHNNCTTK